MKFLRTLISSKLERDNVQVLEWNESLLQTHLNEHVPTHFFVLQCRFQELSGEISERVIGIGRQRIYDPKNFRPVSLLDGMWEKYKCLLLKILDGFVVVYPVLTLNMFAEKLKAIRPLPSSSKSFFRSDMFVVTFRNKTVALHAHGHEQFITIEWPGHEDCVVWTLNLEQQVADLASLFHKVDKDTECYDAQSKGIGTFVLNLIDAVHMHMGIKVCLLFDDSKLKVGEDSYSAQCVYSSNHNGLSFYMSRGFLSCDSDTHTEIEENGASMLDDNVLEDCIDKTNDEIRGANAFWNRRGTRTDFEEACGQFPNMTGTMLKPYQYNVTLRVPEDPFSPAMFVLNASK